MLVAKNQPAHIHVEVRDFDGVLTAASGSVSVVVKDVDGSTVASGTAAGSQHGHDAGIYSYTLPSAVTDTLGVYEATASYTLSGSNYSRTYQIEVVGAYLFEIHELRARDRALENEAHFPAEAIREAREVATAVIERSAQVSFARRAARAILSGDGTSTLILPDVEVASILGCVIYDEGEGVDSGDDVTGTELEDIEVNPATGVITRTDGQTFPRGSNNVLVDYEHGYEYVPARIKTAAMILAEEAVVPSGTPVRATSQSTDLGDFRISVANVDYGRDTGIPEVDAAVALFGRRRPRLG